MKEMTTLAKIIYKRTYARQMNNGKLENWEDTINRVIEGNVGKFRGTKFLEQGEEDKLKKYMREL